MKSLEAALEALGNETVRNDPKKRRMIELLAAAIWSAAVKGDATALRILADRLPAGALEATKPTTPCERCGHTHGQAYDKADPTDKLSNVIMALCKCGIFPPDLLIRFSIAKNLDNLKMQAPYVLKANELSGQELIDCIKKNLEQSDPELAIADVILTLVHGKRLPESVLHPYIPMLSDNSTDQPVSKVLAELDTNKPQ